MGSVNIAGVSYFKVLLLLDLHALDVLCLQETWLVGQNKQELDIPGYTTLEQRREKGKRGGIAILVRNSLKVLQYTGNEYAQQVVLGLPDGQRAAITNVYLPPY